MTLNNEQFAYNVDVNRERSSFPFNWQNKTTMNAGQLVPLAKVDILPGDTISGNIKEFARMSAPLFPTMDNAYLDVWAFFVPSRLCWNRFKEFRGEEQRGNFVSAKKDINLPHIVWNKANEPTPHPIEQGSAVFDYLYYDDLDAGNNPEASLLDYFAIPYLNCKDWRDRTSDYAKTETFDMLPFEAYNLIWNNFFRDQNSMDPQPLRLQNTKYTDAHAVDGYYMETNENLFDESYWNETGHYSPILSDSTYLNVKPVCKFHDAFTSALPNAQKGAPVPLPGFGDDWHFPVVTGTPHPERTSFPGERSWITTDWNDETHYGNMFVQASNQGYPGGLLVRPSTTTTPITGDPVLPTNLWAQMAGNVLPSINDLRYAFAVQRILEADARGGNLYGDIIYAHFGVENPDARMQLPEYLGGGRTLVQMQETVQTSETGITPQGNVAGVSRTYGESGQITKTFTEYGYFIVLGAIRTAQSYQNGLDRHWTKRDKYDFYTPELACVGEMPITYKEVCCGCAGGYEGYGMAGAKVDNDKAFGFNEAWYWYRYPQSTVTGKMRSMLQDSLDAYHYAESYYRPLNVEVEDDVTADDSHIYPILGGEFLSQEMSTLDRSLTFSHTLEPQFLVQVEFDFTMSRCMPVHSIPGLVDHY